MQGTKNRGRTKEQKILSKLSGRINQGAIVLQDPSGLVDHIINNPLGREDLLYLSCDATGEPWSGTKRLFWVLLEVIFDWHNPLFEKSFGFGLTVVLPTKMKRLTDRTRLAGGS